jgi:16S rRNA (cytosine967-C5)-methyltransferase
MFRRAKEYLRNNNPISIIIMISPARKLVYAFLYQIELRRIFSDDAVNSPGMIDLDQRDRNLVTEILYGCLRWQGCLDFLLSKAISRKWEDVDPGAKALLRMSLYQMWKMDRIPNHALVNDAVEIAKRELGRGIEKFINGVLRKLIRSREWQSSDPLQNAPAWVQVSLPEWLWNRWESRYGEEAASEYAVSLTAPPRICGRFLGKPADISNAVPSELVPDAFILQDRNSDSAEVLRQDEASQLIPHLLGPTEGFAIWDCCAAPGGKSAILSAKCGKTGRLIASDLQEKRARLLAQTVSSSPVHNSSILLADASALPPFLRQFDAVLVDAPCSGLGTLRRNPEIKWNLKPGELGELHERQATILASASKAVRPGGLLLYSTCSTEPEENEKVVHSFLNKNPFFRVEKPANPDGIFRWIGEDNFVRTFPTSHLWDGFFAALMVRAKE